MKTIKEMKSLKNELALLRNEKDLLEGQLTNTLSTLVETAGAQTALTSFNPIVQNNIYAPLTINHTLLTYFYKTHGIIQTAIDVPVLDALRGGVEPKCKELSSEELEDLTDKIEEYGVMDVIGEATIWTRLYGGGGIIINTDQDPTTPLNISTVKRLELYAANRWELASPSRTSEYFNFYGVRIHKSRVLTMSGKAAPYMIRWQLAGWGMSEIERMVEDFNKYIRTSNVIYELLEEAKIDVYRLKDFNSNIATSVGTNKTRQRIQLMNQLKNFHRALIMDSNDEFAQKQLTFSGLADIMKENRIGIASALRIPMTKLFGLSASGFNSGEDDIENYNAMVESEVRNPMKKVIRKILKLLGVLLYKGEFDIGFSYKALRVLSAVEEETVKTSKQARITSLYSLGLMDSQEAGEALKKEGLVTIELKAEQGLLDPHPTSPLGFGDGGPEDTPDVPKGGTSDGAGAKKPATAKG